MSSDNFIKNITSKDNSLAISTTINLIKTCDIACFQELAQKSDFIFPFLKDKIITNFVKLINKEDLNTVFEFTKIYSLDFEDLIIKSWLKFASEDLTDKILELFEKGTNEQKCYCASYFKYIKDPLALEFLNKYAMSEFSGLKINCALALAKFEDETILNKMKNAILNSNDNFEKLSCFEFISAYGGQKQVEFILENGLNNPLSSTIIANLLNFNPFSVIKNYIEIDNLARIFHILIESYPEVIELDTLQYYEIYDFIEFLNKNKNDYSNNLLLATKKKFEEFYQNDIYSFDLDKNLKEELKNIYNLLNSINLSFEKIENELKSNEKHKIKVALFIVEEYNLSNFAYDIANLINSNIFDDELIALGARTLKKLNKINLINQNTIEKIENENIKVLIESYKN